VVILYFPLLLLVCLLAIVFARGRPAWTRTLYRTALALATLPYGLHVANNVRYASRSWPEVSMYVIASSATMLALLAAAMILIRRVPLGTPLLPAALWLAYWFGCLPLIYRGLGETVLFDNIPNVWLFASSAFAVVVLAGTALSTRPALARDKPPNRPLQRAGFARP
jgi:hypothetical protein